MNTLPSVFNIDNDLVSQGRFWAYDFIMNQSPGNGDALHCEQSGNQGMYWGPESLSLDKNL